MNIVYNIHFPFQGERIMKNRLSCDKVIAISRWSTF